jgi:predicted MFS family arabinose efflux permease
MSFGFHYFNPSNNGVVLMSVDKARAPRFLGQLRSLGALAAVVATGAVYLFASRIGYGGLFLLVGGLVIVGGLVLFPMGKGHHGLPERRRVIFRKRYWLFYTLAFLMGSRRHIFTTFAVFLLVSKHGIRVETTATLFLVNALINTYAFQLIGRLVARLGERVVLTVAFAGLIPVFLGYAYVDYLPVLYVFFVIDNVLFGCNLAMTTYLQKIAVTQEELTSNLSLQDTINHTSAVIVPVVGGTVWALFGFQAPFLVGVGIAATSLILVQFIRTGSAVAVPVEAGVE